MGTPAAPDDDGLPVDLAIELDRTRLRRIPGAGRWARAAVAVVLTPGVVVLPEELGISPVDEAATGAPGHGRGPSLLFIRRVERRGDPWSGQVAFPGGRMEEGDADPRATAERELREETGVRIEREGRPLGRLGDVVTRTHESLRPLVVTPYVYLLERTPEWRRSPEAAELLLVPWSWFEGDAHRTRIRWGPLPMPAYDVAGRTLWGLTLLMLDDLRARATIVAPHRAHAKRPIT